MKTTVKYGFFLIGLSLSTMMSNEQELKKNAVAGVDYISILKDTLNLLAERSDNEFFKMHCQSIIAVINSKSSYSTADSSFLASTYTAFCDNSTNSARDQLSYLNRKRKYIMSWISDADGTVSFSWLRPPKNWNPEDKYPLYIQLHGLWSVASNSIEYLTYPFRNSACTDTSFEDGYLLEPWGRGNLWYQGISESDIWECMAALEKKVKIDPARKYLSGHSMGGYGAWYIASKSASTWAALGIHAGALWYDNYNLVTASVAESLKDLPTYFVCGTSDGLLSINQTAYQLLSDAGDPDIHFATFDGAHVYIEENVENMYLWMRNFVNHNVNEIKNEKLNAANHMIQLENYPNPVRTFTHITFVIYSKSYVSLSLYDMNGSKISEIMNNEKMPGTYNILFDASKLAEGIYFLHLKTGNCVIENKMIVIK